MLFSNTNPISGDNLVLEIWAEMCPARKIAQLIFTAFFLARIDEKFKGDLKFFCRVWLKMGGAALIMEPKID